MIKIYRLINMDTGEFYIDSTSGVVSDDMIPVFINTRSRFYWDIRDRRVSFRAEILMEVSDVDYARLCLNDLVSRLRPGYNVVKGYDGWRNHTNRFPVSKWFELYGRRDSEGNLR